MHGSMHARYDKMERGACERWALDPFAKRRRTSGDGARSHRFAAAANDFDELDDLDDNDELANLTLTQMARAPRPSSVSSAPFAPSGPQGIALQQPPWAPSWVTPADLDSGTNDGAASLTTPSDSQDDTDAAAAAAATAAAGNVLPDYPYNDGAAGLPPPSDDLDDTGEEGEVG